jgi:Sec7-like guanine-nucleotide exchange factor
LDYFCFIFSAFTNEFDFHDMPIDIALRKFQSSFRLPVREEKKTAKLIQQFFLSFLLKGEAQKIEQLMKVSLT